MERAEMGSVKDLFVPGRGFRFVELIEPALMSIMDPAEQVFEEARRAGIDLDLTDTNLALPVQERWRQHDAALAFILKLEQAKIARDVGLQPTGR